MKFFIYLIITLILSLNGGKADIYKCITSAKKYEKVYHLPENLLVSVALTESGKRLKSGEFVKPSGGTLIEEGDTIALFTMAEDIPEVERLLQVSIDFF